MVPLDDVLVHLRAAVDVVRLDGQHLLQGVRRAVGFQRPDLHLAEALAAELRLAAQRLLGDERVRAGRTGVHLVVDQVMELEHVHVTHGDLAVESLAGAAVEQRDLAGGRQARHFEHRVDLGLGRAVEHRGGKRHAALEVVGELDDFLVRELLDALFAAARVVDLLQHLLDLDGFRLLLDHLAELEPEALGGPAQVRFKDLAHVHPRRHAQRVQHDVHRRAVGHVRHVLDRSDLGDHALVAVAAGHLVAGLQAALHRDIDLDHLQHARRQLVALGELLPLGFESRVELAALLRDRLLQRLDLPGGVFGGQADVEPVVALDTIQIRLGDLGALDELLRSAVGDLAVQEALEALERVGLHDTHLVGEVGLVAAQLILDDLLGTLVALDAFAREDLDVDNGARDARGHAQARVFHVGGFLAENRAQQLFFRRQLGFALGRDLADQHVTGLDFGTDVDDARLVQARELPFGEVRDVTGDLFRAELGVAGNDREFLDVDRGEPVFGDHALGDEDRILEVVAVPGHERDQHVLAERKFAEVGRGTIRQHITAGDDIARRYQRTLVDAGVLVGTGVLGEVVDVDAGLAGRGLAIIDAHHDA